MYQLVILGAAALVGAPPPYSALPVTPLEDIPGLFSEPLPEAMLGSQPLLLHPIKREDSVVRLRSLAGKTLVLALYDNRAGGLC